MTEKRIKEQPLDHPVHRAGPGEGARAPWASETGVVQQSIYDGAGNEVVVVTTTNEEGVRKQGTGPSAEAAMEEAQTTKEPIGKGFGTAGGH